VAQLIVRAVNLEDIDPDSIDPEAPLFSAGLGLDSIDALELALGISRQYGFQITSEDAINTRIFANLRTLSRHIEQRRTR
jgi:acyl carrier protein